MSFELYGTVAQRYGTMAVQFRTNAVQLIQGKESVTGLKPSIFR